MKRLLLVALALLPVLALGVYAWWGWGARGQRGEGDPWFIDATEQLGVDFVHDAGEVDGRFFMPQSIGSGAALFDLDGDERLDLYLLHNGGPKGKKNQLFRQRDDATFEDVSKGSGLDFAGFCMGAAVGDVNNDGRPDVLVTMFAGARLFLNEGGGKFRDVTAEAGLDGKAWGASAAFLDFDRDGRLDLVIVHYVACDPTFPCSPGGHGREYCPPRTFPGQVTRLYRNAGEKGKVRFEDVTLPSGLGGHAGPGLGVVCADFNGDGWPDIFVANDGAPNHLWINQHNSTFKEEAVRRGVASNAMGQAEAGMGVAWGDVDGDGLADLVVTHLTEETHTLWMQGPLGLFRDRTQARGLGRARWRGTGFGAVLADFDNDGRLDLAAAHGRIARAATNANPELGPHWGRYAERNQLLAGGADGFRDVSTTTPALCGTPNVARGLAWGDLDNDGAVDLVVTTIAGRARVLRNVAGKRGHWLTVRAVDLKRDALGAEVRVEAGGETWLRCVQPASSYLCSNDPRAHFGLGDAARVDRVVITWPDGLREAFAGGEADRRVTLRRGEGRKP